MHQPMQGARTPEPVTPVRLLSSDELADYLQLTPETVRRLTRRGDIPSLVVARRIRYDLKAVIRHLENNTPERQKAAKAVFESLRDTLRPGPPPVPSKRISDVPV